MKTVREQVSEVLGTINAQFKGMDANQCSEFANVLASLLPNILDQESKEEIYCNNLMVELLDNVEKDYSVAEAKLRMQSSPFYSDYRKVRALRIGVEETIRTLKARIKVKINEEQQQPTL